MFPTLFKSSPVNDDALPVKLSFDRVEYPVTTTSSSPALPASSETVMDDSVPKLTSLDAYPTEEKKTMMRQLKNIKNSRPILI